MSESDRQARAARLAVLVIFAAHSFLFASWTAHIPGVKAELGLDDAQLGLAILGAPVGAITAIVATGRLLARFGSQRVMQATLAGYCASAVTVGLAGSQAELFGALALWGLFQGSLDVAMNTQGVTVERAIGRPVMSGFHCAWSLGGFAGAGTGALVVGLGGGLAAQLAITGVALGGIAGFATMRLLPDPEEHTAQEAAKEEVAAGSPVPGSAAAVDGRPARPARGGVLRQRTVLLLGFMGLACMLCEGAAADWSAVQLRESLGASGAVAGLAYASFSAGMVVLRFTGDRLMVRFPAQTAVPLLAAAATVSFSTALATGSVPVMLVGWATLGLGVALIIPAVLSAAGRIPGVPPGTAVAAVSGLAWAGYVGSPPLIGFLAHQTSLQATLVLIPVATATVAIVARFSGALRLSPS
ncbi:MAG: MFS transporter [Solirubrobacteraceae bacterium]|nr:MFS transporter [Solirubrobacteraceae bacterium]